MASKRAGTVGEGVLALRVREGIGGREKGKGKRGRAGWRTVKEARVSSAAHLHVLLIPLVVCLPEDGVLGVDQRHCHLEIQVGFLAYGAHIGQVCRTGRPVDRLENRVRAIRYMPFPWLVPHLMLYQETKEGHTVPGL